MTRIAGCVLVGLLLAGCNRAHPTTAAERAAADRSRLKWSLSTTVEVYKKAGHTNPEWDEPAEAALTEFARVGALASDEDALSVLSNNCTIAISAGCDDPMIQYLHLRFPTDDISKAKLTEAYGRLAPEMEGSAYPKIRKFYVWLRTHRVVTQAYGYGTNVPQQFLQLGAWSRAESDLMDALSDRTMPPEAAYDACHELLEIWDSSAEHYASLYHACEKKLPWSWKNEPMILLLKGEANIHFAWDARGNGTSDTVSKKSWKIFEDDLEVAEKSLTRAWEINPTKPRIAHEMMRVELGQGQGRERMEMWFKRAMQANSNYYDACAMKLIYLEPKWYGSPKDALEFGRECASNPNWGGHIPLILMDAHMALRSTLTDDAEKANYWKRPEVWEDLKLAFDRFFELNPEETSWYHNYAWYAWQAGQWAEFNATIPKLGYVNYNYFGGREKFDAMVAEARQRAGGVNLKD